MLAHAHAPSQCDVIGQYTHSLHVTLCIHLTRKTYGIRYSLPLLYILLVLHTHILDYNEG